MNHVDEEEVRRNNGLESPYFRPKTYTVNDFHMLVEGIKMERESVDKEVAEWMAVLSKRSRSLCENNRRNNITLGQRLKNRTIF
jgi:hypothetical protein